MIILKLSLIEWIMLIFMNVVIAFLAVIAIQSHDNKKHTTTTKNSKLQITKAGNTSRKDILI